jgi:Sulfotransferase domain
MPSKGVHYFDTSYAKGQAWYRGHFPSVVTAAYIEARGRAPMRAGEASPYYLYHPEVPARVAAVLPQVKLVAMLRNPVDRAYSQYANEFVRGFEDLPFEEALQQEPIRLAGEEEKLRSDPGYTSFAHQHHSYLARGLYLEQLERWHAFFSRTQLLVLDSGRFFTDPAGVLGEVHEFLGVDRRHLVSYPAHNAREREALRPETRARLEEFFAEPNRRLFDYLGVDFGWNRTRAASPMPAAGETGREREGA